ncbi:hypothetical protein C7S18_23055 [Ahniella affigens]|uniref:Spore protein YkvP/CgeB glycosyl transferase-like domain-containing protein n=1 Tax=Ahniella affigens TaxID=2021234 RepID=A0A2P1PYF7_9GAMM|nr:glycosyltransferase [Ahniella affigens]AVP99878.1 hypothetical protein C7S18_23055 [Ahniella affigens]
MKVLILISGHLLSCPRAVKFADALSRAGHSVQVMSLAVLPSLLANDQALASTHAWSFQARRPSRALGSRIRQTLARRLVQMGIQQPTVLAASEAVLAEPLVAAASGSPFDLLLLSNLPAYAAGLRLLRQRFAARVVHVDLEDDHVDMLPDRSDQQAERVRRQALIAATLAHADLITAASPLMAADLSARYGKPVRCVLNVFDPVPEPSATNNQTLIWQSQTIGPERGLEALIRVLGLLPNAPKVLLRGMLAPGFDQVLKREARAAGLPESNLQFSALSPPAQLLEHSRGFRAGLAIEVAPERNRQHCLTNKLFEYLAAGVPVILSQTPAHSAILPELLPAAVMIDLNAPKAAADALAQWLDQPATAQAAAAYELARTRFNWATHSQPYLAALAAALPSP